MKDIEFNCPHCGQQITCDASGAGRQVQCPTCQKTISVPSSVPPPPAGATAAAKPPPPPGQAKAAAPAAAGSGPVRKPAGKKSGLSGASLVLSLSSILIGPLGFIPGIVCGHVAKARIKRDPTSGDRKLANAGLAIGYGFLGLTLISVLLGVFVFAEAIRLALANVKSGATNHLDMVVTIEAGEPTNQPGKSGSGKKAAGTPEAAVVAVARDFLDAYKQSDSDAIKKLLTRKARQNYQANLLKEQMPEGSYTTGKAAVDGDQARVQCKAVSDGFEIPLQVRLRREGGQWRVRALALLAEEGQDGFPLDLEEASGGQVEVVTVDPGEMPGAGANGGGAGSGNVKVAKEVAIGALVWLFGSEEKETTTTSRVSPLTPEIAAEERGPLDFGQHRKPVTLRLKGVETKPGQGKVKVQVENHSNKSIQKLEVTMYFLDAGASVLGRSTGMITDTTPHVVARQATGEVEFSVPNIPQYTDTVTFDLKELQFKDSTTWKPEAPKRP